MDECYRQRCEPMKVLFVMPGAGDAFYCGNCFRDNLQAMPLRKASHEVVVVPLYLPVQQSDAEGGAPLFFPATTLLYRAEAVRTPTHAVMAEQRTLRRHGDGQSACRTLCQSAMPPGIARRKRYRSRWPLPSVVQVCSIIVSDISIFH